MKKHVVLNSDPWCIEWVDDIEECGLCDYATRTIRIRNGLHLELEFDTVLHELEHAQRPYLTEEVVDKHATERAKIVVDLYRPQRRVEN